MSCSANSCSANTAGRPFEAPDINKRPACSNCTNTTCSEARCWGTPKPPQVKSAVPPGAKTAEFYEVANDLPARFNNPEWFGGYGSKKEHPLYRTTNTDYGKLPPTVHSMPLVFRPMTQKFSEPLGKCGMYRDNGLTTWRDKSCVPDH